MNVLKGSVGARSFSFQGVKIILCFNPHSSLYYVRFTLLFLLFILLNC